MPARPVEDRRSRIEDRGSKIVRLDPRSSILDRLSSLFAPKRAVDLTGFFDLTLSHPEVEQVGFASFDGWLSEAAAWQGLSCALIHAGIVEESIRRLRQGKLRVGLHLDYFALWHVPGDRFALLAETVQDAGGRPINPPEHSRLFTDKVAAHTRLREHGLGVPDAVAIPSWQPDRPLTEPECRRLGLGEPQACVYVKPANGFGCHGVVRVETPDADRLAATMAAVRTAHSQRDGILIQRAVRCPRLPCNDGVERPAYWRVLWCLGELLPFWWNGAEVSQGRPNYRRLTDAEIEQHGLTPVLDYVRDLAELCELDWFSTELCLSEGAECSRHAVHGRDGREWPVVAIDYVNDQCDVDVQSRWLGAPPDDVVRHLAERFAEAAGRTRRLTFPRPRHALLRPAA